MVNLFLWAHQWTFALRLKVSSNENIDLHWLASDNGVKAALFTLPSEMWVDRGERCLKSLLRFTGRWREKMFPRRWTVPKGYWRRSNGLALQSWLIKSSQPSCLFFCSGRTGECELNQPYICVAMSLTIFLLRMGVISSTYIYYNWMLYPLSVAGAFERLFHQPPVSLTTGCFYLNHPFIL